MKSKFITICFLAFSFLGTSQYNQFAQYVMPYLSDSIESGFFYLNQPNNFQAGQLYQTYRQNAPDLNNNMVLVRQTTDDLVGMTHYTYHQTFMNIIVEGAGCIEHFNQNGSLSFVNAKIADTINESYIPSIRNTEAINSLTDYLRSKNEEIVFAWEDENWESELKEDLNDQSATYYPNAELIWSINNVRDVNLVIDGDRYKLAYEIEITTI